MIGHAVFDLDGTLVDSAPLCASILNAMLAERDLAPRLSVAETRPHVTRGGRAMVAAVLGPACGDIDQSLAEFRARYAATPTPPKSLYAGVEGGLRALKADGVGLAVWSNKPQALCEKVLVELGLSNLFDAVVGTAREVPHKPDPAGFDRALMLAGGQRTASCFVGDTALDHACAQRARVPFIWVTYGYGDAAPADTLVAGDFAQARTLVSDMLARR